MQCAVHVHRHNIVGHPVHMHTTLLDCSVCFNDHKIKEILGLISWVTNYSLSTFSAKFQR